MIEPLMDPPFPLPFPFGILMQSDWTSDACWLAASFQTRCSTSKGPFTVSSRSSLNAANECSRWIDRMRLALLPPSVVAVYDVAPTARDWLGSTITSAAQHVTTSRTSRCDRQLV
jgi:hypothetical protein